jgi:DNA-binding GntR family transcriptional regulator
MMRANFGDDISESVCEAISLAIAEGALRPGVKIVEDVIAAHFGVSRTVARGAVAILERERIVERRRNHGAFVATPDKEQAAHLLEARRMLEVAIVERAVATVPDEALDRLEAMTQDEDVTHSGTDAAAKNRISGNFHLELARAAGNQVLFEMLKNVVARLSLVAALYERSTAERCGAHDHRKIIDAIRRRDERSAMSLMKDHLETIENRLDLSAPIDDQSSLSAVLAKFAPKTDRKARQRRRAAE